MTLLEYFESAQVWCTRCARYTDVITWVRSARQASTLLHVRCHGRLGVLELDDYDLDRTTAVTWCDGAVGVRVDGVTHRLAWVVGVCVTVCGQRDRGGDTSDSAVTCVACASAG